MCWFCKQLRIWSIFACYAGLSFSKPLIAQITIRTELLVAGGGTGGSVAGIQAAREGVKTIIAEQTAWLGGMLTAACISCTDGNDGLASGIWEEFRQALYKHYRNKNLATGWVSETCFEPHVGDSIFKAWAAKEKKLTVLYGWYFEKALKNRNRVTGAVFKNKKGETLSIYAKITIDATETGDLLADADAKYDLGTEDASSSGEKMAPGKSSIIQDITWAVVLKDYGPASDKTIARPKNYDAQQYACSCLQAPCSGKSYPADAKKMLDYGRLPNQKFMINWPAHGNDFYAEAVESTQKQRNIEYTEARLHCLGFIYFVQTVLGFKNLGLAADEADSGLAFIPYNREGRRVRGLVRMNINHIIDPYNQKEKLYRTGIAVGDYPVDHHHAQNPAAPLIAFPAIPSYNIPLGVLIPENTDGLIVCEKGISVSNIVNGTTRLQPVVLLTGQAAGILAALCMEKGQKPRQADPRLIQEKLLKDKCYLMPYADVPPDAPYWESVQRVGVTGILKGTGKAAGWANKTFFYPDSTIGHDQFKKDFSGFDSAMVFYTGDSLLTIEEACSFLAFYTNPRNTPNKKVLEEKGKKIWYKAGLQNFNPGLPIKRWELAVLLDKYANVFYRKKLNLRGEYSG